MPPNMQKTKEWVVPLVCIIIVLVIVLIGQRTVKQPEKVQQDVNETPIVEWPSYELKKETIKDSNKQYEINAAYPVTQDESITSYLKDFVTGEIESFKQNIGDQGDLAEGYPVESLDISYEERRSDRADNYIFTVSSDTGGAHGLAATKTFSFTKAGDRITLDELFTNDITGLTTVSNYVKAELKKREYADAEKIEEGAAPRIENYQNFTVENTGVTFIFDPYQVAAYAAGTQTVSVPKTVFSKFANPELFK